MTENQSTHYVGCYDAGRRHYDCALAEIERLKRQRGEALVICHDLASWGSAFAGVLGSGVSIKISGVDIGGVKAIADRARAVTTKADGDE